MIKEMDALMTECGKGRFFLFLEYCKGCGLCIEKCPTKTLAFSKELGLYGTPAVEPGHGEKECTACGICETVCPDCAIKVEKRI